MKKLQSFSKATIISLSSLVFLLGLVTLNPVSANGDDNYQDRDHKRSDDRRYYNYSSDDYRYDRNNRDRDNRDRDRDNYDDYQKSNRDYHNDNYDRRDGRDDD